MPRSSLYLPSGGFGIAFCTPINRRQKQSNRADGILLAPEFTSLATAGMRTALICGHNHSMQHALKFPRKLLRVVYPISIMHVGDWVSEFNVVDPHYWLHPPKSNTPQQRHAQTAKSPQYTSRLLLRGNG